MHMLASVLLFAASVQYAFARELADNHTSDDEPHATKFVEYPFFPPKTTAGPEHEKIYATKVWSEGSIALTFDDGPYIYTSHILDVLETWETKATFFINGDNWSRNIDDESTPWPALLRRMVNSGHQIGIHGWSHINMSAVDAETRYHEVHDLEVALYNILGKYPTYFRPPYGACNIPCIAQLQDIGYHVIGWDVDSYDWQYNTEETWGKAFYKWFQGLYPLDDYNTPKRNYMVLLHDVQNMTASFLLPSILERIRVVYDKYLNITVGDCFHDPPENWYQTPGPNWDPNPSQRYWDVKAAERAWHEEHPEEESDD